MKVLQKSSASGACPDPEAVVAFVMDGESGGGGGVVRRHIEDCDLCRQYALEMATARDRLREDGDLPCRDMTDAVMRRLPMEAVDWTPRGMLIFWRRALRIAAALVVVLGIMHVVRNMFNPASEPVPADPRASVVRSGQAWLLERQAADGGWDVAALGGRPEYTEALCGLAVLALAGGNASGCLLENIAPLKRAGDYLLARQAGNGLISRDATASMYNHGIATLALLELHVILGDARMRPAIDKALAYLYEHQSPSGGWGYRGDLQSPPNTSITAWQVMVLLQAREQGWAIPQPVIGKALSWIEGTVGPQGYFGYEGPQPYPEGPFALTMMGAYCLFAALDSGVTPTLPAEALIRESVHRIAPHAPDDYHQAFFFVLAMELIDGESFHPGIMDIQDAVIARQLQFDGDAGAWPEEGDRWGTVGGKLYSTTMAMLTLARNPHACCF